MRSGSLGSIAELTGTGAYEGLSAILFLDVDKAAPFKGTIYPTDIASCDFSTTQ